MNLNRLLVVFTLFMVLIFGTPFMLSSDQVQAVFPGVNGKIVFASKLDLVVNYEIYVIAPNGFNQTRITFDLGTNPVWSPNGSKIAFERGDNIYIMNANGLGVTQVTSGTTFDDEPSWSPDGSKIAFVGSPSTFDPGEIYVINTNGSGLIQLTSDSLYDTGPVWSPDGSKIVFSREPEGDSPEIFVMNANGTGMTQLTDNDAIDDFPTWSPDGSKIAFSSTLDGDADIYIMNADGSGLTKLTSNSASDIMPCWSPDGQKIAFASDGDGDDIYDIYKINIDGSNGTRVTSNAADDFAPDWQAIEPPQPPTLYSVVIDVPGNLGNVSFNGTIYTDADLISIEAGSYNITGNPATNYTFVRWESDGGVTLSNALSSTTMCTVSANGTLRMVQEAITPILFVIIFDTEPPSMGTITFDSSDYSDGDNVSRTAGTYGVTANPAIGYAFSRWETFGLIIVSNSTSPSTNCTVNGLGTVKLVQTEITIPPPTTPTPTPPPSVCIIVTATYGSPMASEVLFVRNFRDNMIGSNYIGEVLVCGWNKFYYSWSPPIAYLIATHEGLQQFSQVLILPLIGVIYGAASIYSNFTYLNSSIASIVAFLFASISCIIIYIVTPFYGMRIIQKKIFLKKK
ncbi:CFI-box-CTERM domain-containing protein [[Eubacterium] cellulosolvens]